jgi:hypothetical protein
VRPPTGASSPHPCGRFLACSVRKPPALTLPRAWQMIVPVRPGPWSGPLSDPATARARGCPPWSSPPHRSATGAAPVALERPCVSAPTPVVSQGWFRASMRLPRFVRGPPIHIRHSPARFLRDCRIVSPPRGGKLVLRPVAANGTPLGQHCWFLPRCWYGNGRRSAHVVMATPLHKKRVPRRGCSCTRRARPGRRLANRAPDRGARCPR